jgi:hypothetical protein
MSPAASNAANFDLPIGLKTIGIVVVAARAASTEAVFVATMTVT